MVYALHKLKCLHAIVFAYKTTFKVGTSHIPFQLVCGLYVLNAYQIPISHDQLCNVLGFFHDMYLIPNYPN
jgi:hypothetical protein